MGKILANKETVIDSSQRVDAFARQIGIINSRMDQVVNILLQGGSAAQVFNASRQSLLGDRMLRRVQTIVQGGDDAAAAADGLNRDAELYGAVLNGLLEGNPSLNIRAIQNSNAREILTGIQKNWNEMITPAGPADNAVPAPASSSAPRPPPVRWPRPDGGACTRTQTERRCPARRLPWRGTGPAGCRTHPAGSQVFGHPGLAGFAKRAVARQRCGHRMDELPTRRSRMSGGVCWWRGAALFAILLVLTLVRDQRRRYHVTAELNQRNQEAILRLLDEMGSLAEGDLTVKATVTEDITGAIADSVNFAVEALRSLVTTINETAVKVSAAAQETQATAMHLADAAQHQASQITSASAAINDMATSIDGVSKNSAESADVAQRSVEIATKGAGIVRQTIEGMDSIRDQIQETSKRIKRLGESSKEIGSIVELINDIAEQTNILSLNAAIQAASAGEAGRGFAVVADEVQRLAERSANATKRIETLVQTIQSDTNEAVSSMEQTTAEVVTGARLAEDAGTALGEIEKVSNDLSGLIQNISASAKQQSAAATNISDTMNVIQEITSQTSVGASQTAESIGNLAGLAGDLRRSVADFKLPGD